MYISPLLWTHPIQHFKQNKLSECIYSLLGVYLSKGCILGFPVQNRITSLALFPPHFLPVCPFFSLSSSRTDVAAVLLCLSVSVISALYCSSVSLLAASKIDELQSERLLHRPLIQTQTTLLIYSFNRTTAEPSISIFRDVLLCIFKVLSIIISHVAAAYKCIGDFIGFP